MVIFVSHEIAKQYYCHCFSRIFVCANLIYLVAIVLPILVLVSMNSGWPTIMYDTTTPILTYTDYQLSCNSNTYNTIYYSSFTNQANYISSTPPIVGNSPITRPGQTIPYRYSFNVTTIETDLTSCNLQLYFSVQTQGRSNNKFVGALNFYTFTQIGVLSNVSFSAVVKMNYMNPLLQSWVPNTLYSSYYSTYTNNEPFSMPSNLMNYNNNNISLITQDLTQTISRKASGNSEQTSINVNLYIPEQTLLYQNTLLNQMREFWRQYIYILIPLWFCCIYFLRWMIQNKIYSVKQVNPKKEE